MCVCVCVCVHVSKKEIASRSVMMRTYIVLNGTIDCQVGCKFRHRILFFLISLPHLIFGLGCRFSVIVPKSPLTDELLHRKVVVGVWFGELSKLVVGV